MAFTYVWDASFEAAPTDDNYGYEIDDNIRKLCLSVRERMEIDHIWKIGATDGEHKKITFSAQIAKPTAVANQLFLYTKDISAKVELFAEDEDGNEVQLTSAGKIPVASMDAAALANAVKTTILSAAYPVGCIYTSIVSTNPNTVFGFGTWVAFGAGKVPVGYSSGDSDFGTVEGTGGAKTHTLVSGEMPAHTHAVDIGQDAGGTGARGLQSTTVLTTQTTTSAGGGGAHNNLQPFIVVYMWKRTA